MLLKDFNRIHFIGIGGISMSSLAEILQHKGKKVSGSDGVQSAVTDSLVKMGINVVIGQKAENITDDIDLVVYTAAVNESNPELVAARASKATVIDRAELVGMLMLGNLFRESGVVKQLTETASNALMYIVVILLGTSVGASTSAEAFLKMDTLKIVALGMIAFAFGTAGGVLLGKLLCKITKGKINPLIGSAGVSAVPMAARVSQKVGAEADPSNFLLMHAMGPNVAGVIGTAVAAGTFMAIFGV